MAIKDIATLLTVITSVIAGFYYGWIKMAKPVLTFIKEFREVEKRVAKLETNIPYIEYIDQKANGMILLSEVPMFLCDRDGECIMVNRALCELFGGTEYQLKGYGWTNFIHPDDRSLAWQKWLDTVRGGSEDIIANYRILHGETSQEIHVVYHAILSRDKEKEIIVAVGAVKKGEPKKVV